MIFIPRVFTLGMRNSPIKKSKRKALCPGLAHYPPKNILSICFPLLDWRIFCFFTIFHERRNKRCKFTSVCTAHVSIALAFLMGQPTTQKQRGVFIGIWWNKFRTTQLRPWLEPSNYGKIIIILHGFGLVTSFWGLILLFQITLLNQCLFQFALKLVKLWNYCQFLNFCWKKLDLYIPITIRSEFVSVQWLIPKRLF